MRMRNGFVLLLALVFACSISVLIIFYQRLAWDSARLHHEEIQQQVLYNKAQKKFLAVIARRRIHAVGIVTKKIATLSCAQLSESRVAHSALTVYQTQISLDKRATRCLSGIWLAPIEQPSANCSPKHVRVVFARLRSLIEQDCRGSRKYTASY